MGDPLGNQSLKSESGRAGPLSDETSLVSDPHCSGSPEITSFLEKSCAYLIYMHKFVERKGTNVMRTLFVLHTLRIQHLLFSSFTSFERERRVRERQRERRKRGRGERKGSWRCNSSSRMLT
jgi:hypothetical protein